jgi:flagellar hook-associated protein 2
VSSLAKSQTIEFTGFSSKNDAINKGTINIDFGSWSGSSFTDNAAKASQSVVVSESNNTLSGLAASLTAISGVNATVTDKGNGTFSLIINSDTGAKKRFKVACNRRC